MAYEGSTSWAGTGFLSDPGAEQREDAPAQTEAKEMFACGFGVHDSEFCKNASFTL